MAEQCHTLTVNLSSAVDPSWTPPTAPLCAGDVYTLSVDATGGGSGNPTTGGGVFTGTGVTGSVTAGFDFTAPSTPGSYCVFFVVIQHLIKYYLRYLRHASYSDKRIIRLLY